MKKFIHLSIIFCSLSLFSQNNESSTEFDKITLDGEVAYRNLKTGEILDRLPNTPSKKLSKESKATNSKTNSNTHFVVKGETLFSISKRYGVSVTKLKELNANINFKALKINQKININDNTIKALATNEYVVKKGNTLYAISRMFTISVSDLKRINNLSSALISVGQKLRIK